MKNLTLIILLFLGLTNSSKAQQLFVIENFRGEVVSDLVDNNINGSQFLHKDWLKGNVILKGGEHFDGVNLKYSNYKNEVYFEDQNTSKAFNFLKPVEEFSLIEDGDTSKFKRGFLISPEIEAEKFYQVIYDGEIKLISQSGKMIMETKAYGPSATEKKFVETNIYFIERNNELTKFIPNKKNILALFENKSSEMKGYLDKNKVDYRKNGDLAKMFEYYYSL